jgi:hypothetical protein
MVRLREFGVLTALGRVLGGDELAVASGSLLAVVVTLLDLNEDGVEVEPELRHAVAAVEGVERTVGRELHDAHLLVELLLVELHDLVLDLHEVGRLVARRLEGGGVVQRDRLFDDDADHVAVVGVLEAVGDGSSRCCDAGDELDERLTTLGGRCFTLDLLLTLQLHVVGAGAAGVLGGLSLVATTRCGLGSGLGQVLGRTEGLGVVVLAACHGVLQIVHVRFQAIARMYAF